MEKLYAGYGEVQALGGGGPDSQKIEGLGEEYLARNFSRLDKINQATIVDYTPKADAAGAAAKAGTKH